MATSIAAIFVAGGLVGSLTEAGVEGAHRL